MSTTPTKRRVDVLARFDRHRMVSGDATDLGLVQQVYAQAIALGGESAQFMRGLSQVVAIGMTWVCGFIFQRMWLIYLDPDMFIHVLGFCAMVFFGFSGLGFLIWTYFLTFFLPGDSSVVFDRKNKYVHWVTVDRAKATGLSALGRMPLRVVSVPWSLIDAEHRAVFRANTASASYDHDLAFIVHRSAADPTVMEEFGLAPSMLLGRETVPALYEHIRRYMEEDGPPWSPGVTEPAPFIPKPKNWWQSMGLVGPFGPRYLAWWKQHPGLTLAVHLLFPITIPVYLLWGLFNWLSYATEQKVAWPQNVLDTLGPVLKDDEVRAGKGGKLVAR
ncbi:DUF6708 domain-containing protein [Variovorax boronicumulans]|uniref:DUF6708 domain-containing protein n=1 Tax=Variovorax boronicumulans TaxID=436515 RepID=UPI001C55EE06